MSETQTHDDELVEIVTAVASILADRFSDSEDWCDAVAVDVVRAIEPLITRKAKEEQLKQMMEWADASGMDKPEGAEDFKLELRTFATEHGIDIEGGE